MAKQKPTNSSLLPVAGAKLDPKLDELFKTSVGAMSRTPHGLTRLGWPCSAL
jgi:hypothetical protein